MSLLDEGFDKEFPGSSASFYNIIRSFGVCSHALESIFAITASIRLNTCNDRPVSAQVRLPKHTP